MVKHRVLIVDDYPDAAEMACLLLALEGHVCIAASSGSEALARAPIFAPDIAILDIGLPDLSGYELARALREQAAGRPLYLAAVTGWGQASDRDRALAAGFDHHVMKPAETELAPDTGGIIRVGGRTVGGYRDPDGTLHTVRPTCTHLGCRLHWNGAERSWDCPCHGSRFSYGGEVLEGPAVTPLEVIDVDEDRPAR